jgi:hypothetical protein
MLKIKARHRPLPSAPTENKARIAAPLPSFRLRTRRDDSQGAVRVRVRVQRADAVI